MLISINPELSLSLPRNKKRLLAAHFVNHVSADCGRTYDFIRPKFSPHVRLDTVYSPLLSLFLLLVVLLLLLVVVVVVVVVVVLLLFLLVSPCRCDQRGLQ